MPVQLTVGLTRGWDTRARPLGSGPRYPHRLTHIGETRQRVAVVDHRQRVLLGERRITFCHSPSEWSQPRHLALQLAFLSREQVIVVGKLLDELLVVVVNPRRFEIKPLFERS